MKLTNKYELLHDGWFDWTVYIDGTDDELNKINQVTYILHKSFSERRIVSTNQSNNFARTNKGWGEFLLKAEVILKNGNKMEAELWLDLGADNTMAEKSKYNGEFFLTEQVMLSEVSPKD